MHDSESRLLAAVAFMSTATESATDSDGERRMSTVAARFGLDGPDREALRQISVSGVARFAAALRIKRVENIAYIFRRTLQEISRLDGSLLIAAEKFWHACPPRPADVVNAYMDSAAGFRDLLAATDYPDDPWLPELAATEYAIAELIYNAEPAADPPGIGPEALQRLDALVQASPNIRLLRLRWDVLQFLGAGPAPAVPTPLSPLRHVVLCWTIESSVQAWAVSASTFTLLEACFEGPISVDGLLARWTGAETDFGPKLRAIYERGLVTAR